MIFASFEGFAADVASNLIPLLEGQTHSLSSLCDWTDERAWSWRLKQPGLLKTLVEVVVLSTQCVSAVVRNWSVSLCLGRGVPSSCVTVTSVTFPRWVIALRRVKTCGELFEETNVSPLVDCYFSFWLIFPHFFPGCSCHFVQFHVIAGIRHCCSNHWCLGSSPN